MMKTNYILSSTMFMIRCYFYLSIITMKHCQGFTFVTPSSSSSFTFISHSHSYHKKQQYIIHSSQSQSQINLRAPPGSGYLSEEDETSFYPDTYQPMMEYPGTMRPGKTPENQPYSSLPIQESDPDPVPWPHFQEIEWHHNWGSPHEHPIPMEEFIDMHGRWATAEMEAEMRAGARRGVRERRELEEAQKAASFILDDDDDDEEENGSSGARLELGEGVDALIGAGAAAAATISSAAKEVKPKAAKKQQLELDDDEDGSDDDGDNFLLDLGLDETSDEDEDEDTEEPAFATGEDSDDGILEAMQSMIDAEDDSDDIGIDNEIDIDFDDLGLNFDEDGEDGEDDDDDEEEEEVDVGDDDFVVMDDDDISMDNDDMTLDEMIGNEDMGADDEFDDGGFDYD